VTWQPEINPQATRKCPVSNARKATDSLSVAFGAFLKNRNVIFNVSRILVTVLQSASLAGLIFLVHARYDTNKLTIERFLSQFSVILVPLNCDYHRGTAGTDNAGRGENRAIVSTVEACS
jgi:hypothetical protein